MLKGGVIGTLMSNYGLEKYFKSKGIKFLRANVGDRYERVELSEELAEKCNPIQLVANILNKDRQG